MSKRTRKDFYEWCSYLKVYNNYNRYGYEFGHGMVVAISYMDDDDLKDIIEDVSGGDVDARVAVNKLLLNYEWFSCRPNITNAFKDVMKKIEHYYFNILNKGEMQMIAKECCGSCKHFDTNYSVTCRKKEEDVNSRYIDGCYIPHKPIENKYEKMWEDLKNELALKYPTNKGEEFNKIIIMVIESINKIERNYHE